LHVWLRVYRSWKQGAAFLVRPVIRTEERPVRGLRY
jgi:hypothetical protein